MTLSEWIESQPFSYTKVNIRQWGSYELQVTIDGRLAQIQQARGRGWTEKDAFEDILTDMMKDSRFHNGLKSWLGEERFNQITSILAGGNGEGDREKVSSTVERLEENAGGSSEGTNDSGLLERGNTSSGEVGHGISDDQRKYDEPESSP